MDANYLQATGLNDRFHGQGLSFAEYITQTQAMITQVRCDGHSAHAADILQMNSPFDWKPGNESTQTPKRGVLLIHGLYDSPFSLMEIGRHLLAQGFWVRAVLLPGHGTVPGDLLSMHYSEWLKAVDYGIDSFPPLDELWLAGFSVGGSLVINAALRHPSITGLMLFSPALQLIERRLARLAHWHSLISWAWPAAKWYQRCPQTNWVKYQSYAFNAAYQAYALIRDTQQLLDRYTLPQPIFIAQSADDETVTCTGTLDFFNKLNNPDSRLLLYQREAKANTDPRIETRTSYFPEQKILDFSHVCLPFSPDNFYYGEHGQFRDFSHYPHCVLKQQGNAVFLGSVHRKNLAQHVMQRLTYNPDFASMLARMDAFLMRLSRDWR